MLLSGTGKMKIVAIYSSKGGVGKTATAVNLSYRVASLGKKTLLCDLDSQGAAGYYFRIRSPKKLHRKKLLKGKFEKFIRGTDYQNLDLLPSHLSFRNLDLALDHSHTKDKKRILKQIFEPLAEDYEALVLDCPPNLTLLSENIFRAADVVVTPVIPTTLSIRSLKQLLKMFDKMDLPKEKIAPFFSMAERKKRLHCEMMDKYWKYKFFLKTVIPFTTYVERMGVNKCPVAVSHPHSDIEQLYSGLQMEVWKRSRMI